MSNAEIKERINKNLKHFEENHTKSRPSITALEQLVYQFFESPSVEEVMSEEYLRESKEIVRRVGKIGEGIY
jgi:hypothetical protein